MTTNNNNISVDGKYQTLSSMDHVKKYPHLYVGDINTVNATKMICVDDKFVDKDILYNKGFIHIFRELLDNAFDNQYLNKENSESINKKMTKIGININKEKSILCVYNNGVDISLEKDKNFNKYIPEIIFEVFRSSSNYKKTKSTFTCGLHGYGAKLTNYLSLLFKVEIVNNNKKYIQIWKNGISYSKNISDFKSKESYIKIIYIPNYKYFNDINSLTDDSYNMIKRLVYDKACCLYPHINIYFQNEKIKHNNFKKYISLFSGENLLMPIYHKTSDNKFELAVTLSDCDQFKCYYFINSVVSRNEKGTLIDCISTQICNHFIEKILRMTKKEFKPTKQKIKRKLFIIAKATIFDPHFSEQTKDTLITKPKEFGFEYILPYNYLKKLTHKFEKEIITSLISEYEKNNCLKIKPKQRKKILNKANVTHARFAGHKTKKLNCSLIITEGQSASTLVLKSIPALPEKQRDYVGVYSLTGKIINVRKATKNKINNNKVFQEIVSNLGLEIGTTEINDIKKKLRYGNIIIMCDQDSVTGDTPLLLKDINGRIVIKNIEDLFTKSESGSYNKKYCNSNYKVWTNKGWSNIKHVMRHKVTKKIFRVLTHTGCVDVTEDHSLLNINENKISPNECKIGNKLLHNFPLFKENEIFIPDNLNKLTLVQLRKYAKQLKLWKYQSLKKEILIKKLQNYKQNNFEILNEDNLINIEEAYVMGLFFADGSCDTYNWKYKYMPSNRPNKYTFNKTSYSWHIDNTDISLLNKSLNIMNKIYEGNYFKIIKLTNNDLNKKNRYRLILNGGRKTKYIIDKYRKYFYYKKYKYLHEDILNSKREIREQIYIGFYDGDGLHYFINSNNSINKSHQFDVNSKITSQCIFYLCKSLGYNPSINHQIKRNKIYSFLVSDGFYQKNPNEIKKIIELKMDNKNQYVYDLETENHHFQAGVGQMIVHNTDGFHIRGLLINFIHRYWPELLKNNFVKMFVTNIVVATHKTNKKQIKFMSEHKYNQWKNKNDKKNIQ